MEPLTTVIVASLAAGTAAAAQEVATDAIKTAYAALKKLVIDRFGKKADVADALAKVEARPDSPGRKATLEEELEAAGAGRDPEVAQQARALLDLLHQQGLAPGASYHATVHGSGAIAQGQGATAAGERGVAIGGSVHDSTIVSGDDNVVVRQSGDVQVGGIRARRIEADNVVSGVQAQGVTPSEAADWVALAGAIQRGEISADEIVAGSVVSGLQFLSGAPPSTPGELRREVAALRTQVQQAVARGEIGSTGDAEDVQDALERAETELARPEPDGKRVTRQLDTVAAILTGAAQVAQAAGKVGLEIVKLAPVAAALYQLALAILR